jgi:hypothetical protein
MIVARLNCSALAEMNRDLNGRRNQEQVLSTDLAKIRLQHFLMSQFALKPVVPM